MRIVAERVPLMPTIGYCLSAIAYESDALILLELVLIVIDAWIEDAVGRSIEQTVGTSVA
jgi:hypothetical protein